MLVRHVHRYRLERCAVERPHRAENDVMHEAQCGAHLQGRLHPDHHRTDVQGRVRALRHPPGLRPHQRGNRLDMIGHRHLRHAHPLRGTVEALGIAFDAEQIDVPVGSPVGLGAVEHHLSAVERLGGWIECEWSVGHDTRIAPTGLSIVLHEHRIGEYAAEAEIGRQRRDAGRGRVFGADRNHRGVRRGAGSVHRVMLTPAKARGAGCAGRPHRTPCSGKAPASSPADADACSL